MASQRNRRLAAILAADVVGYSRLMRADEEGTLAAVEELRERILSPATKEHSGRLFKSMGDGFLLEFSSVVAAIRFAMAVQTELESWNESLPKAQQVQLRMGLNVGDVIAVECDLYGDAVNVAARLEAIADPGGICISETALQQLGENVTLETDDLGNRALKNIEKPVRVFRVRSVSDHSPVISDARNGASPAEGVEGIRTHAFAAARPSVAILPFRNIAAGSDSEFIAQGISLGIQTLLVQLPNMFFVNACSHSGYRDGTVTAAQALAHMQVRYAIEGSVQQAGDKVRVNVHVTDLQQSEVKWASNYDRSLDDVFALQDEIARSIAGALSVELIGGHLAHDFTGSLDSPGAWEHFLRGINYFYRMTKTDHSKAITHFEALAEAHPDSAIGPCYLSVLHYYAAKRGWAAEEEASLAAAETWARRAIPLVDGNNGLGHAVLGALALEQRRHEEARKLCHDAVGYRASCPFAHAQLGITQTYLGQLESSIRNIREAIELRMAGPVPLELNALAIAYRDHGDFVLSISAAEEATRIAPEFLDSFVTLTSDFSLAGDVEKARQVAGSILLSKPDFRIADFIGRQPYQSTQMQKRITAALQDAGLPD